MSNARRRPSVDAEEEGAKAGLLRLKAEYNFRRSGRVRTEDVSNAAILPNRGLLRRIYAIDREGFEKTRVNENCLVRVADRKAHPNLVGGVPA
jgi:hypothetical protein